MILLSAGGGTSVLGDPTADGRRLIQYNDRGDRSWMDEAQIAELSRRAHEAGHCGGFMDVTDYPDVKPLPLAPFDGFEGRKPTQGEWVRRLLPELQTERLSENVVKLMSFRSRYYQSESGVAAVTWVRDQFVTLGRGRTDVSVALEQHSFKQPSVIARITGSGPRANETVILGAHADSINASFGFPNPGGEAPGADDDGSGVSTLLEVYRVLVESGYRPDRSIEFMAYAGEERGLLGSQAIAARYQRENRSVAGVVQFDMTMFPGQQKAIALITDHTHLGLTAYLGMLVDEYVGVRHIATECGYACSDHASWSSAGFAAAFPFEAPFGEYNRNIHTARDTLDPLDITHGLHYAKLGVAFAVELGSGE